MPLFPSTFPLVGLPLLLDGTLSFVRLPLLFCGTLSFVGVPSLASNVFPLLGVFVSVFGIFTFVGVPWLVDGVGLHLGGVLAHPFDTSNVIGVPLAPSSAFKLIGVASSMGWCYVVLGWGGT